MRNGPWVGKGIFDNDGLFYAGRLAFYASGSIYTKWKSGCEWIRSLRKKRKVLEKRKESMSMSDMRRILEGGLNFASIYIYIYQSCF